MKGAKPIILALAFLYLFLFGFYGLGRDSKYHHVDLSYFYTAGTAWLEGKNPYDLDTFREVRDEIGFDDDALAYGFAYPPPISTLCIALASLPFEKASLLINALNLIALGLLCYACCKMLGEEHRDRYWLVIALIVANPITAHVFWLGQSSLIVASAISLFWVFRRNQVALSSFFVAIAAMKPQLSIFPIFWLFVEKRIGLIFASIIAIAILSLPTLLAENPFTSLNTWYHSLFQIKETAESTLYSRNLIFNLETFFNSIGYEGPSIWLISLILLAILAFIRRRYLDLDILSLLAMITTLFLFIHDYDLVILAPAIAAFTYHLYGKKEAFIALLLLGCFYVPQRLFREADLSPLAHMREWALLVLFLWLAHLGFYRSSKTK